MLGVVCASASGGVGLWGVRWGEGDGCGSVPGVVLVARVGECVVLGGGSCDVRGALGFT